MEGLSLFNIGFRSENICIALHSYNASKTLNKYSLLDSEEIIKDCFRLKGSISENLTFNEKYELSDLYLLIFKIFEGKDIESIIDSLNEIQTILSDINNGEQNVNTDKALFFFEKLSQMCLIANENNDFVSSDLLFN